MGQRLKLVTVFLFLGFGAGLIANFTFKYIIPWLAIVALPIVGIDWILSGIAGASVTVALVTAWAYASKSE